MNGEEKGELVSQLRNYVILSMLLRKGLVTEIDIEEQIGIVRAEVPFDHSFYAYLMDYFDCVKRMTHLSPHSSPVSTDPMVPTE